MTNSLGLPDRCFSTHLQLHLHNRRVSTTLQDYPVSSQLFPVCSRINRWTHHSHFHPLNFNQHCHQCHLPLIRNSQDLSTSPASRVSPNQRISPQKLHQTGPFKGHPNRQKTINKLHVCAQKQKKHTVQHLHLPTVQKKLCE